MRYPQGPATKGSQKWLQVFVNTAWGEVYDTLAAELKLALDETIEWLSPLADDDYAEYSDAEFIERLDLDLPNVSLSSFWPNRGPVWDGLARTSDGKVIVVEAKAHIPEMITPPSGAKSPSSLSKIHHGLDATKIFLGVRSSIDWSATFYQYANRLAHLYLLRELNGVDAYLLFVYFVNARDMDGPKSIDEWRAAIQVLEGALGIPTRHKFSDYVIHAFVDVERLNDCQ